MSASAHPLLDIIGNTPLLPLRRIAPALPPGVLLLGKAEHLNPSGSLKDRPARALILEAAASGRWRPGMALLDATSGNAGIAYAMVGAALGIPVTLCLPAGATPARRQMLSAFGARFLETPAEAGSEGARAEAARLAREEPWRWCLLDQYGADANWKAHRDGTGAEIWDQTRGTVTHLVAGVGTSGTLVGASRLLKGRKPSVRVTAVIPDRPDHGLPGLRHLPSVRAPAIWDPRAADAVAEVATVAGRTMATRLAQAEGLLVGPSTGAVVHAAVRLARGLHPGSVVVAVLADSGDRYLA